MITGMPVALPPAAPIVDPVAVFPELIRLKWSVQQGDWLAVSAFFADLTDPDDIAMAARTVADTPGAESFLRPVTVDQPTEVLPRSLLACHYIRIGWENRSGYRATRVSRAQVENSHTYLRSAEQLLIDAVALDPSHQLGWYLRLMTARGLAVGRPEARRRYDRLAAYGAPHFGAQSQFLQQLCPKWGGSWEAVHDFAMKCREGAQAGGLGAVITADAHLEHWAALSGTEQKRYWRTPGVLVEAAAVSVLHPDFRLTMAWVEAHSTFAAAFSMAGEHRLAAPHFRALGSYGSTEPWQRVLASPLRELGRHRDKALAKG